VIDTSVLFSPRLRAELQELAFQGMFVAVWSPWIIAELNRVLVWQWINDRTQGDLSPMNERACSQAAKRMMTLLLSAFEVVNPRPPYPPAWDTLTDSDDHPIWAAAVESGARYVVSDNVNDYPPRQSDGRNAFQGVEYISGPDFLEMVISDLLGGIADE
jgi:predicted nucleic acid-binding protein